MRGAILENALRNRVRTSGHTVDIYYLPTRALPVNPPMSGPPANLLTGPRPVQALIPVAPTTDNPPVVGLQCLWQDLQRITNQRDRIVYDEVGWVEGAHAYMRVLVEDVLLDKTQPYSDTVFEGMAYLIHAGKRYTRLQSDPVGRAFADPFSYQVWLRGAWKD